MNMIQFDWTTRSRAEKVLITTKLWQLLKIAIEDLDIVRKNPEFKINMHFWLESIAPKCLCSGCMAGAVLYNSFEVRKTTTMTASKLDVHIKNKMLAIDALRKLDIFAAYIYMQEAIIRRPIFGLAINEAKMQIVLQIPHHNKIPRSDAELDEFFINMKKLFSILKSFDV